MKKFKKTISYSQEVNLFCQLENVLRSFLVIYLLSACSSVNSVKVLEAKPLVSDQQQVIMPGWFKISENFSHRDPEGNYLVHPFFDLSPKSENLKDQSLFNYFVTVPFESLYKYNFDLYSGKLYKERNYCSSNDVWDIYTSEIFKPNFTQGIVPRTYDQNLSPQKIIIFSNSDKLNKNFSYDIKQFHTARVLGSFIIEFCEVYPCGAKSKWLPSQILVGVDSADASLSKVSLLSELKSKFDWNYVRAMLVNQDGVHKLGQKTVPAYRITRELTQADSLKYLNKNSKNVDVLELEKWRETCFKLYNDIWDKSEIIRLDKVGQKDRFFKYFKEFYKFYYKDFNQCQKLVRPANITENDNRLWFFSFLQAFSNLESNGYYYNCWDKSWAYNPYVQDDHYYYDQAKEFERCHARDFEKIFDQTMSGLGLMRVQTSKFFRFIEYDTQRGGSHQKLYSWVQLQSKSNVCLDGQDSSEGQLEIFPQDVVWPAYLKDEEKIIK